MVAPEDDVECGVCSDSGPAGLVSELAFRKAAAIVRKLRNDPAAWIAVGSATGGQDGTLPIVLAADTVVDCDGLVLGKPRDETDARRILTQLSGREHRVLTGVCMWRIGDREPMVRVAVTTLRMDRLSAAQLEEYLASGQWEGKAGAFGYQDRLGWVHIVEGSESNVVGLPMELVAEMLSDLGAGEN